MNVFPETFHFRSTGFLKTLGARELGAGRNFTRFT